MGISTSAVIWFGYAEKEDVEWADPDWAEAEGDDDATVGFAGWYDSNVSFLAVPGTITTTYDFASRPLGPLQRPTDKEIRRLAAAAEAQGFPTDGKDPQWYFTARQC